MLMQTRTPIMLGIGLMLALTVCSASAVKREDATASQTNARRLEFSISLTEGEHSRDSNSTLTTITLSRGKLKYDRTYTGFRANKRTPIHKEIELSQEELQSLAVWLRGKKLLASHDLRHPITGPRRYCELTATIELNRKTSRVRISGMIDSLAEDTLYKDSREFIQQVEAVLEGHNGPGAAGA